MKKYFALAGVISYTLFGMVLLFQMANERPSWETSAGEITFRKDRNSDKLTIHQATRNAVINVRTPALAEALFSGKVKVVHAQPDSSTLIRIVSGQPGTLTGEFKNPGPIPYIESNGKVEVVNGSGIYVRSSATFDWAESQDFSTLEMDPNVRTVTKQGNVYALVIKKRGYIKANLPEVKVERPPLITDEAK